MELPERSYIYYSIILVSFAIFTFYYKRFIMKVHPTVAFSSKARAIIIFTSSLTIFLLYINIQLPVFDEELLLFKINLALELIYFICIFVLYQTSIKRTRVKKEFERLEIEMKKNIEYMQSLEKINKEMQKFQHDYANILLSIRGYLETDNLQGLKHYFQSHILKAEQRTFFKNEAFNNLDNLKIVEIKGLLTTKIIHADHLGIKLNIEIPETIESINMDIIDLTRIIGILTDNAIEACSNCKSPQINIAFMNTNHNTIMICIDNTIEEFKLNLDDIYKENYSTKGKNRGIGLTNVKDILRGYETVNLSTQVEDGWFMQELEIPVRELVHAV
ncbi:sensor histidine kinase [Ureibacillus manganicus]|nr:GHKL domain-containing protein [Ureibacillus manganicus]